MINELEGIMNQTSLKIAHDLDMVNAVQRKKYIVGSFSAGVFSVSSQPFGHYSEAQARAECSRLATANPNKLFVYLQIQGAEASYTLPTRKSY